MYVVKPPGLPRRFVVGACNAMGAVNADGAGAAVFRAAFYACGLVGIRGPIAAARFAFKITVVIGVDVGLMGGATPARIAFFKSSGGATVFRDAFASFGVWNHAARTSHACVPRRVWNAVNGFGGAHPGSDPHPFLDFYDFDIPRRGFFPNFGAWTANRSTVVRCHEDSVSAAMATGAVESPVAVGVKVQYFPFEAIARAFVFAAQAVRAFLLVIGACGAICFAVFGIRNFPEVRTIGRQPHAAPPRIKNAAVRAPVGPRHRRTP